jgi:ATP-dependent Clp protease ATP-binding subunit ClpC
LADKRILSLDMTSIVAGTKYRGQFEERMKVIIEELQANPDIIVFIDEIHTIVGAGNSSGSLDASNIFKPALARGEIQCIGATTLDEYRKNFEKDGALERRFQKVIVDGATKEETFIILQNLKDKYENFHKVSFTDEVLETCVNLAERYITDREFPDKAIDILDEVGARSQVDMKLPEIIEELKSQALEIKNQKVEVVKNQKYEEAAHLRDKEKKVLQKLDDEKKKFEEGLNTKKKEVSLELVYDVVSNMTKIPVSKLNADDAKALIDLDENLNNRVIGQSEAVKRIAKSIRRNRLGIKDPNRPIGSFIFLGSTGVGKTYLAKQLAKEVFGSVDNLIRVDMSEYQEKHTVSRLIGAPPGYVGYDEGGQLTEQVKNKPYSVILFDEIEKANKDIFSSLLQMLDDGHMTDGLGRKINFKNCIIIMTSNLGVKKLQDFGAGLGFSNSNNMFVNEELRKQTLQKELKKFFSPEFLNRIDDTIIFNSLGKEDVDKIVAIELDKLKSRLNGMKYQIKFDDSISKMISNVGFDEMYGARPLKRAIQDKVEDFISEEVLKGNIKEEVDYVLITEDGENVTIQTKKKKGV